MYQHHVESLEIMRHYFAQKEEVIAVVFGGSVAQGCERPDSDLDCMVVLTKKAYEERVEKGMTTEVIGGMCTYEGGYFDIKYMTKEYLEEAAMKGSEPTRNSFMKASVIYSKDESIAGIVERIPVFQKQEAQDKMLSFYSNLQLNYHYFLKDCKPDGYMLCRVCSEIIYSIYRMILQEQEVLFPCNRRLEDTVDGLMDKPDSIVALGKALAMEQTMDAADEFVSAFQNWSRYTPPADYGEVLSRYVSDFEQWWRVPRPLVAEW